MNKIFDQATRTAALLQKRSPSGQLEMFDSALDEGYAVVMSQGFGRCDFEIEWHGISAIGVNELDAIAKWVSNVIRKSIQNPEKVL